MESWNLEWDNSLGTFKADSLESPCHCESSLPRQLVFPPVSEKNSLPFLENPVIISLEEEDFKMILTPFKKYHNHNLRPPEHTITQKKIEYQNNCNTLLSHMARNPREDMRKWILRVLDQVQHLTTKPRGKYLPWRVT